MRLLETVLTPTGDYRYLAGVYSPGGGLSGPTKLSLSVFDGAHAFLFVAEDDGNHGPIAGTFYSGNHWKDPVHRCATSRGRRLPTPRPPSPRSASSRARPSSASPRLDEPPYAGKPVIVEVMGTWCPNCHDAARLLAEYYDEYHDEGLEIFGLAYEHSADEARSLQQIERFKARHGAAWEIVPAGISDKRQTSATLPALTDIKSYPTDDLPEPRSHGRGDLLRFQRPRDGRGARKGPLGLQAGHRKDHAFRVSRLRPGSCCRSHRCSWRWGC